MKKMKKMKTLLMIVGVAAGTTGGVALAQHEKMAGHENMPPGDHANHKKHKKQGDSDGDKKQPPKSDDQKHEGHDQR